MRRMTSRALAGLALALALLALPLTAQVRAGDAALPGWLAGSWSMEDGAAWADETWTSPRGGMMLGALRHGFGPGLDRWETARIERKAGVMMLVLQPGSGGRVEFPVVLASAFAIEFANPAHDFPQRIRYERVGQLLVVELSLIDGSDSRRAQYRLTEQGALDM